MQHLCVLVTMCSCLVMSAPEDVAVAVQKGPIQLEIKSSELTQLHMCLCKGDNQGCVFNTLDHNVTSSHLTVTQNTINTEDLTVYMCTLQPDYANCTRSNQSLQHIVDVHNQSNSFSLHNTETCDIRCVDVMWDDSITNVTLYTDKINAEQCSVKSLSDPQNVTHTTTVIFIIITGCLILIIISVIIIIRVCIKRKSQVNNPAVSSVKSQTCSYRDVDNSCGFYAVSPTWHPDPEQDREQEPLYFEVEKDKLDPHEVRENIQIESNNLYSQLHDKTENVMNEYDVLPR